MTELFIYYRAKADRADTVRREVQAMQDRLRRRHPHLTARLLRRPEATDGLHTWMETYACDPSRPEAGPPALAEIEAEAAGLLPLIEGARHVETFLACAC